MIARLYDECQVPVLLLCTKDLVERIRKDNDQDHGQMYSRLGWVCDLTRDHDKTPGGKKGLFTVADIRRLYETDKIKFHPDAQAYLQDVANSLGQGSLRSCDRIVRWAIAIERHVKDLGQNDSMTLTAAVLHKAEEDSKHDRFMLDDMRSRMPSRIAAVG